jgi:hypothetical protein
MSTDANREPADDEGTKKPEGLGQDGTIPNEPDGVAAGHTGEPSTFEPEEDEAVDDGEHEDEDEPQ